MHILIRSITAILPDKVTVVFTGNIQALHKRPALPTTVWQVFLPVFLVICRVIT